MPYVLNGVTAPDSYSPQATIENVPIQSIIINIVNQAVYFQLKTAIRGGSGIWQDAESALLPGSTPIVSDRVGEIAGIRFRAAVKAANLPVGSNQALVTIRTEP